MKQDIIDKAIKKEHKKAFVGQRLNQENMRLLTLKRGVLGKNITQDIMNATMTSQN